MTLDEAEAREEHAKELFASHGVASYRAQLLEQRLASLLSTAFGDKPALIPWEEFQTILKEHSAMTFGQLVARLRDHPAAYAELIEELGHRVDDRNYLVHRFFWTHAEDIVDKERREFLIQELKKMAERFRATNEKLRRIYYAWLNSIGISMAQIESALAEASARAKIT